MSKASGQGKSPKAHPRLIAAGVPNNTHETNHEETQPHCYALADRSDPGGPLHDETFVADPIPMNVAGLLREPGAASKATASEDGGCNHRWRAPRDVGSIREHDNRVPPGGGCTRNEFLVNRPGESGDFDVPRDSWSRVAGFQATGWVVW